MTPDRETHEPWYLLYHGTSTDGRGNATYVGRTLNAEQARSFVNHECSSPHATGYVLRITDTAVEKLYAAKDIP